MRWKKHVQPPLFGVWNARKTLKNIFHPFWKLQELVSSKNRSACRLQNYFSSHFSIMPKISYHIWVFLYTTLIWTCFLLGHAESRLSKALVFPDSPLPVRHDIGETEHRTEIRRGGTSGYKASVIHSKRNHTIGLGEQDQLDLIVTESVIRWASCTHIQGAPSLRSSLVC